MKVIIQKHNKKTLNKTNKNKLIAQTVTAAQKIYAPLLTYVK